MEGVGTSGDSPTAEITLKCNLESNDLKFALNILLNFSSIKKDFTLNGDFTQSPIQFYLHQLEITGPRGTMLINHFEIEKILGQNLEFEIE